MEFAGQNYAYISKKKIDKTKELLSNKQMREIKEENDEMMESIQSRSRSKEKKARKKSKSRSRSNSLERNCDDELDMVYSDEGEFEEEINQVKKEIDQPNKSGLFTKIGNSIKGLFSKSKSAAKKKKVLYSVAQARNQDQSQVYEHEVDTNVLSLKFEFLKDKVAYALGDPIKCNCEAVFNKFSSLEKIPDSEKLLWLCEFCGEKNAIYIEEAEIPKEDCIDYFVQSINQIKGLYNYTDEQSLIFCFDISGSMCVSSPVEGKHKFKGSSLEKNYKDLMAFSDGSDQFFGGSKNVTYISRLQCLQAAIESNLSLILQHAPNRKVGLVAFNNEVLGFGDCSKPPVKINGNNLDDAAGIVSFAEAHQDIISSSLKDAHNNLLKQLYSLEETGQTALGPAVLFSINLFKGVSPGSRIILCTDGISNTGIGSMDGVKTTEEISKLKEFYSSLGMKAKEKGVVIDLITFEEEQSNIEVLMAMVEQSGGEILRVKPTEILEQFSNLLTNEVVATNVKIKVKLHKLMQFRNEDQKDLLNNGTTLVKEIGNATKESELFVEYCFKKSDEIAKLAVDLEKVEQVPFQAIIDYTNTNGDRCIRVVTKNQKVSSEKDLIQKEADFNIISTNAMQKTSKLAKEGDYRGAQSNALAWKKMIKTNAVSNLNAFDNYKVFNNNMNDFNNNMQEMQFMECEQSVNMPNQPNQPQQIRSDKISQQIHSLKHISSQKSSMNYEKSKKK